MINRILNIASDVSLSKTAGKFMSDKAYGFDTVFFISKFILHNSINNSFDKSNLRQKAIDYIEDIFQLTKGTAGAVNYFLETINWLEFSNVLIKTGRSTYLIKERDVLKYLAETSENSYIFNYLVAYQCFKNDGLLSSFDKYCSEKDLSKKEEIVKEIYKVFCKLSPSIGTPDTQWSKQLVKYPFLVLGFINNQRKVTRELRVKEEFLTIEDVALNIEGTRSPIYLPKKNDYLKTFNVNYVRYYLNGYLFVSYNKIQTSEIIIADSFGTNLAELKLAMLDDSKNGVSMSELDKEQYIKNVVKTRNQSIQHQFRKGLLDNNEHVCPICGFCFEEFLIASHIKPYSKCDDTYDAINHYNGLLLCPNHDKLFEDAKHMTIDAKTGEIILSPSAQNSVDFGGLKGKFVARPYIDNERRHYLKWHNERFIALK